MECCDECGRCKKCHAYHCKCEPCKFSPDPPRRRCENSSPPPPVLHFPDPPPYRLPPPYRPWGPGIYTPDMVGLGVDQRLISRRFFDD